MNDSFSENLKHYRKRAKLSQTELACKLGVGQTSIANYEGNLRFPDRERLITMARILSIPVDTLIGTAKEGYNEFSAADPAHIMQLLLSGRQETAWNIINAVFLAGKRQTAIQEEILIPLLHKTGDLWSSGKISVAEEHVISNAVDDFLERLRVPMTIPAPNGPLIICSAFPGESHILGLKMLRNRLNEQGWQTVFTGASAPENDLLLFLQRLHGDVILISVTLRRDPREVISLTEKIHALKGYQKRPVIIGGAALTGLPAEPVPGSYTWYAADLQTGVETVARLVRNMEEAG